LPYQHALLTVQLPPAPPQRPPAQFALLQSASVEHVYPVYFRQTPLLHALEELHSAFVVQLAPVPPQDPESQFP
jgi:hypothetical protein